MFREAVLTSAVLMTAVTAWGAGTPAQKCEAGKNTAAGKYALCRQKAEGKLVSSGDTAKYNEAIGKCATKFSGKWGRLEADAGGACPTNGDVSGLEYDVRSHADVVAWKVSGAARFTDNADGSITDNQTGLSWEKKVKLDSTLDVANLNDADNSYLWANRCSVTTSKHCQPSTAASTACLAGVEGDTTGCAECSGGEGTCTDYSGTTIWEWVVALNTASFAGHNDWRVPKKHELLGIIDDLDGTPPAVNVAFDGAMCGVACPDVTSAACSCTQSYQNWSASTYAPDPNVAWYVFFIDGSVLADGKGANLWVRAVRGGS